MEKHYILVSDAGVWSRFDGWLEDDSAASIYTERERTLFRIPDYQNTRWQEYRFKEK